MRSRAVVAVAALAATLAACGGDDPPRATDTAAPTPTATPAATPDRTREPEEEQLPRRPRVETVATGLEIPWEIAFLPDGRALITERPGRVRLLSRDGQLREQPVARVGVDAAGEGGLLGLAIDPDFEDNRLVYLQYTAGGEVRVARYAFRRDRLEEEAEIVRGIQAGVIHDGGRIAFGPDGDLWIATGDAGQPALAQQPDSLNGKFLRLSLARARGRGGRPEVVSLGHRNPQGFDWTPDGRMLASEHGPAGDDEVNRIRADRNYGWPEAVGADHAGFTAPLVVYPDSIAPSGASVVAVEGSAWTGDFLVAALRGEQIRRLRLDGSRAVVDEPLFEGRFGRLRTVVNGPGGALYALTSNRDGRGSPEPGDDRVLRIVPPRG